MRGWEGLKVCQKVPQMPAGGARVGVGVGHIYPQGTVPGARRSYPRFLDRNRGFRCVCTIFDRECMGSGVQKVLDTMGSKPMVPENPQRGNFFLKKMFIFLKKRSIV
jgi:hypothetical protein